MNKRSGNMIFKALLATMLLMSGTAMAQREGDSHVTVGGSVFGGGNKANVKGNCSVLVNQTYAVISGDVYGGGALADVNVTETTSGSTTTYSHTPNTTTTVDLLDCTVNGNVYGGGLGDSIFYGGTQNIAAKVYGPVTVNIGELVGDVNAQGFADATNGNVSFGSTSSIYGCNNLNGTPLDNVVVNIYQTAHKDGTGGTINDSVSGTGYAIYQVFGGGNKANYVPATSGKKPTVHIWTCDNTIQWLYGGGNAADLGNSTISSASDVIIDGGRVEWVFGGGNGYSSTNNHTNPEEPNYNPGANVYGATSVTYHAGYLTYLFGGSNEWGNITGSKTVDIRNDGTCAETNHHIVELYGGNNKAPITGDLGVTLSMPCPTGTPCPIDYLFGGSRMADISGNIVLNVYGGLYGNVFGGNNISGEIDGDVTLNLFGGTINNAFGGNNQGGDIDGKITVNMLQQGDCNLTVHNIYGGGYQAAYSPTTAGDYPEINLIHGTVSKLSSTSGTGANATTTYSGGNVYGGGYGASATVTSNPKVNVGYDASMASLVTDLLPENTSLSAAQVLVEGNVYGGGELAPVSGSTDVTVQQVASTEDFLTNTTVGTTGFGGDVYGGGNKADVSGSIEVNVTGGTVVKDVYGGGALADVNVTENALTEGATTTIALSGGMVRDVYGGGLGSSASGNVVQAKVYGPVQVTVNGGTVHDVYGCNNVNGAPTNTVRVDVNNNVSNNVYGGGNLAYASVSPKVYINNGTVAGSVFGGGNGDPNVTTGETAVVTGNPEVTIGDANEAHSAVVTGNVYGGGNRAKVSGNTLVTYNDNNTSSMVANVFGGGNMAGVTGNADVDMILGKVTTGLYGGCNNKGTVGGKITVDVTGGTIGSPAVGDDPEDPGYVPEQRANVHGGGYGNLTATSSDVEVNIDGESLVIWGDVYGGSAKGHVNADGDETNVTLEDGIIHGDLYGGGLGDGTYAATVYGDVQVTVNGGTVTGSVYGCNNANGAPQGNVKVDIYGTDAASPGNYALGNVFGGGNQAAYGNTPDVTIHNCDNSIGYVYGGGNKASVAGTNVVVYGGNTIGNVFAGGNGEGVEANFTMVSGNTAAYIYGGTIGKVFGGNNHSGTINGTVSVNVNKQSEETEGDACLMKIGEVYGGGNKAAGNAGTIDIDCTGTWTTGEGNTHANHNSTNNRIGYELEGISAVYGGAREANIGTSQNPSDITLSINSGIVENVFGGNNIDGYIYGTIQVDIDSTGTCDWYVGNVYGGGNQAAYGNTNTGNYPVVNIKGGLVSGDVFGGGLGSTGDKGKVTGSPQVTVNGAKARVSGGVYGGGSLASTQGNPLVTLTNGALTNVFGGGKAANVTGEPTVQINGGKVNSGVYGGCDQQGNVSGNITVNVFGGTLGTEANLNQTPPVVAQVFGGGFGEGTSTSNNVEVNFGNNPYTHSEYPKLFGDIYGGSAFGSVNNAGTQTVTVNVMNGTLVSNIDTIVIPRGRFAVYNGGNVYGGGLGEENNTIKGKVNGKVFVNIGSGVMNPEDERFTTSTSGNAVIQGSIYGCNNTGGSPQQDVVVNVYHTAHTPGVDEVDNAGYALENVFGGGNKANFQVDEKTATVNVYGCDNTIRRTFGGSNAAASDSVFTMIQGGRILEAYGGGNGEITPANVDGNVTLAIHGGSVGQSFGGSNQQGNITGTTKVTVDSEGGCGESIIEEFFCGGNFADFHGDINAVIECADGLHIEDLYGGCKQADVVPSGAQIGNVHLVVKGGTYNNIFGGSQGRLANTNPLYPNAESADISGNILLEIYGGTVNNAIYGGSHILGKVLGKIVVNIEPDPENACPLDLSTADVYGGGNEADYDTHPDENLYVAPNQYTAHPDYPQINIKNATVKNVFGGGYKAKVTGNPQIRIKKGSRVLGNVYGGGNMGKVDGNPRVIVNGEDNSENPTN